MELGPSTEGLAAISAGLAVAACRWHWLPGLGWSTEQALLGCYPASRSAAESPQHARGPARPCTLPWGRRVPTGKFLVASNGHRPGGTAEDHHCVSPAATPRAFAEVHGPDPALSSGPQHNEC